MIEPLNQKWFAAMQAKAVERAFHSQTKMVTDDELARLIEVNEQQKQKQNNGAKAMMTEKELQEWEQMRADMYPNDNDKKKAEAAAEAQRAAAAKQAKACEQSPSEKAYAKKMGYKRADEISDKVKCAAASMVQGNNGKVEALNYQVFEVGQKLKRKNGRQEYAVCKYHSGGLFHVLIIGSIEQYGFVKKYEQTESSQDWEPIQDWPKWVDVGFEWFSAVSNVLNQKR